MTSRIGDGNGSLGRLAEIAEEARNATTESETSAKPDAKAKGDSHKVSDGMDRETLRNVFHTWKSNANRKTSTREALKPPPPSAPTSPKHSLRRSRRTAPGPVMFSLNRA